jgi:Ca2+-binding EF-hand superfamily protein
MTRPYFNVSRAFEILDSYRKNHIEASDIASFLRIYRSNPKFNLIELLFERFDKHNVGQINFRNFSRELE